MPGSGQAEGAGEVGEACGQVGRDGQVAAAGRGPEGCEVVVEPLDLGRGEGCDETVADPLERGDLGCDG